MSHVQGSPDQPQGRGLLDWWSRGTRGCGVLMQEAQGQVKAGTHLGPMEPEVWGAKSLGPGPGSIQGPAG